MNKMTNQRIIVTLRDDYVEALDAMTQSGVAPSRNALIQRIVAGFLSDVKEERATQNSALGALAAFALLMVGLGVIASILGE